MISFDHFLRLLLDASAVSLEDFIAACDSVPLDNPDQVKWSLQSIWEIAQSPTLKKAAEICGSSVRHLAIVLQIPLRTAESWSASERNPPPWSMHLVLYAAFSIAFGNRFPPNP